jgi:hypothetical protein
LILSITSTTLYHFFVAKAMSREDTLLLLFTHALLNVGDVRKSRLITKVLKLWRRNSVSWLDKFAKFVAFIFPRLLRPLTLATLVLKLILPLMLTIIVPWLSTHLFPWLSISVSYESSTMCSCEYISSFSSYVSCSAGGL